MSILKYIKTNLSKAYWCIYDERGKTKFDSARMPILGIKDFNSFFEIKDDDDDEKEDISRHDISWFDILFDGGGVKISDKGGKPITMLISGPPGSGKTTLALELCLRVAICHGFWSLFISTESETELLIDKVKSLRIKYAKGRVLPYNKDIDNESEDPGILAVYGQENIKRWEAFSDMVEAALEDVVRWLAGSESKVANKIFSTANKAGIPNAFPDILVFDSLNMVEPEGRSDLFEKIVNKIQKNTKLIIVILDSSKNVNVHENWEFACDNIIRLDYSLIRLDSTSMRDYYVRYIEVIKARYQAHAWGRQQMKIYTAYDLPDKDDDDFDSIMRRAHPYREEGGIFIYPSIHFFLSKYKRSGTTLEIKPIPIPCKGLNKIIEGFPEGRCTALMGVRGGHKSHLGYLHILEHVVKSYRSGKKDQFGLIVSLRDDELMTKQHLVTILKENLFIEKYKDVTFSSLNEDQKGEIEEDAVNLLNALQEDNLLEILYFPPGYITPDEFFLRMFMSIYRFKYGHVNGKKNKIKDTKNITLLFNSLDQLSARFPLCAHQPIFIPAMIQCLSGENVTSIFIAVDEPGQPPTQYGLLPMADLILNFSRYKLKEEDYYSHHNKEDEYDSLKDKDKSRDGIILEVSRFSGGQKAGTKGLLELVYSNKDTDSLLADKPGLHFKTWEFEILKPDTA